MNCKHEVARFESDSEEDMTVQMNNKPRKEKNHQEDHQHVNEIMQEEASRPENLEGYEQQVMYEGMQEARCPGIFTMEGSMMEVSDYGMINMGIPYTQITSMNILEPRSMKHRCKGDTCEKLGKSCKSISEEQRREVFSAYWALGNVQMRREFIGRHLKKHEKNIQTTAEAFSRMQNTYSYSLTVAGKTELVCRQFFINTLGISANTAKTALETFQTTGILEPERRGGRQVSVAARDSLMKDLMKSHISRFPRIESHCFQSRATREYLHPDLNIKKMFQMYKEESPYNFGSIESYRKMFKSLNLSFHRPLKDQCTKNNP